MKLGHSRSGEPVQSSDRGGANVKDDLTLVCIERNAHLREMPGDAPTPAAGSSIWNSNGLLDPASLWHSSLMAPPTMNGDPLNSRLFVVCGKSIEVRWRPLQPLMHAVKVFMTPRTCSVSLLSRERRCRRTFSRRRLHGSATFRASGWSATREVRHAITRLSV